MVSGALIDLMTGERARADLCCFQTRCPTMNVQRLCEAPVAEERSADIRSADAAKADETKGTT